MKPKSLTELQELHDKLQVKLALLSHRITALRATERKVKRLNKRLR